MPARAEKWEHAHHHVNAGRDHGGRVDHRADRSGALHRVRQPDLERELGALAHRARKEQQADETRDRDPQAADNGRRELVQHVLIAQDSGKTEGAGLCV